MNKFTITLHNGKEIVVYAKDLVVNTCEGRCIGLNIEGINQEVSHPIFIDFHNIVSIEKEPMGE